MIYFDAFGIQRVSAFTWSPRDTSDDSNETTLKLRGTPINLLIFMVVHNNAFFDIQTEREHEARATRARILACHLGCRPGDTVVIERVVSS